MRVEYEVDASAPCDRCGTMLNIDDCTILCHLCADGAGGHFNCADASKEEQERFLEAHEYRERTCTVTGVEYDETMGARFALSCGHSTWHDGDGNAPGYCQDCGARVDHRGATDREVSG